MPRTCTIDNHPERREIEGELLARMPYRRIASQYEFSEATLRRHAKDCIPEALARAQEYEDLAQADDLKAKVDAEVEDIQKIKREAWADDNLAHALAACDKALRAYELEAKVRHVIQEQRATSIFFAPEWIELKAVFIGVLEEHHPQALEDVLLTLHSRGLTRTIESPAQNPAQENGGG